MFKRVSVYVSALVLGACMTGISCAAQAQTQPFSPFTNACTAGGGGAATTGSNLLAGDGLGGFTNVTSSSVSGADVTLGGKLLSSGGFDLGTSGSRWGTAYTTTTNATTLTVGSGGASISGDFGGSLKMAGWYALITGSDGGISLAQGSGHRIVWGSGTSTTTGSNADTGLSRCAAGVLCVGTGAQGSKAGTIWATLAKIEPQENAPATCTAATDIYSDTSGALCYCETTNTWTKIVGSGTCS